MLWKKDVGTGWAGPVVAGGGSSSSTASDDEEVLAVPRPGDRQGEVDAQYPTKYRDDFGFDNGPRATPTVADGTVFTLGANGDLHAIELASGKKLWHRNICDEYKADKGFFGVACSPLVIGKKVLVNVGGKGAGVVAFDAADRQGTVEIDRRRGELLVARPPPKSTASSRPCS